MPSRTLATVAAAACLLACLWWLVGWLAVGDTFLPAAPGTEQHGPAAITSAPSGGDRPRGRPLRSAQAQAEAPTAFAATERVAVPGITLHVAVRDPEGRPLDGAEVVVDPCVADYPSLYRPDAQGVLARILGSSRKEVSAATDGAAVLAVEPGQPFAFAAQMPGFLPDHRVFDAGEVPTQVVVTLARAGSVRGVLRGGSRTEYGRSVAVWRADQADPPAEELRGRLWLPDGSSRWLRVDAAGRFAGDGLRPGEWRAAVARYSRAGTRADDPVDAVPLVDEGRDLRTVVDFVVTAGAESSIELTDWPLGLVRGRVLSRGMPCNEAQVFGTRPDWRPLVDEGGRLDWDDHFVFGCAPGQHVAADGTFAFRYRDAGPIELRVRHANGAATMPPVIVQLPPPGADATCSLEIAAGAVRGRFPIERLPAQERRGVRAVLYPMAKAAPDPSYFGDLGSPISWSCGGVDLRADGRFGLGFVPDGDWLLRIQPSFRFGADPGPMWQQVVHVQGDAVDLGDLAPPARVTATLHWIWPARDTTVRTVVGVWLHSAYGGDDAAIWAGTHCADGEGATLHDVPPGRYEVVPFGCFDEHAWVMLGSHGITGTPLARPCRIEIEASGAVVPTELELQPLPPPEPR